MSCERNEGLCMLIADWIRNNRELRVEAFRSGTEYRTINEYCLTIEKGILCGGPPELLALSEMVEIAICLIYVTKSQGGISIWPILYGENNSLVTTYDCILYDGKHYNPLIYDNNINFGVWTATVVEEVSSSEMNGIDSQEFQNISSSVVQDVSIKRKADEFDTIAFVSNKRVKSSTIASDRISTFHCNDTNAMTIEKLLQTNMFDNKSDDELLEQTSTNECSIISIDANQTQEKKSNMSPNGLNDQ
ncbi:unnamed protein product [Rotaria magnacalcarata]|uniref:Uncharacterized protein n=1 Tax=Rotaria magnacalcarata TaxID=392030 RepID=A0A819D6B1_9BILA|nr:unnamed protein product [Rotaria magnacalcarata]CAF4139783.1 unnamed protein product [Rotaria magnacalcarata]CAF4424332.1 unnamed protein product [Rotaria magnacalcarata]